MDVDEFVSDHKATYMSIQINMNLTNSYCREVWNYKADDLERLNHLIGTYNSVTKWIKSYLLQCFSTFKMPILMFISVLVFRPEGQI